MDEDALSYLVTGLPGATLTPPICYGQALLEWTPTAAQIGSYTASVTATDSGNGLTDAASDSRSFTVVVRAANSAPLLAPVGNKQVTEGQALSFDLRGVDSDNDTLTYRMTGAPEGAVLDPVTGAFRWTPALNASGSYSLGFTASARNQSRREDRKSTRLNSSH